MHMHLWLAFIAGFHIRSTFDPASSIAHRITRVDTRQYLRRSHSVCAANP